MLEIRKAEANDLDKIVELWTQLAGLHEDLSSRFKLVPDAAYIWKDYIGKGMVRPDHRIVVAAENDRIIGFANGSLGMGSPVFEDRRHGTINDLYVEESHRRRGIGTLLVNDLMNWFREEGVSRAQTGFYLGNPLAKAFWSKLGFKSVMSRVERQV